MPLGWTRIGIVASLLLCAFPTVSAEAPTNDLIQDATPVYREARVFTQSTEGATLSSDEPKGHPRMGATVWFVLSSLGPAASVHTRNSNFDTMLCAYVEKADGTLELATRCSDDAPGWGPISDLTFDTLPGRRYFVQAGGYNGATGSLRIEFYGAASELIPPLPTYDPPVWVDMDGGECWANAPAQTSCTTGTHFGDISTFIEISYGYYNGRIESIASYATGDVRVVSCDVTSTPDWQIAVCDLDEERVLPGVPFTHTCRSLDAATRDPGGSGDFACRVWA